MGELLKDMYNKETIKEFGLAIKSVYNPFDLDNFLEDVMDKNWRDLELKARGRHIMTTLGKHLPADYKKAINIINQAIENYEGAVLFCIDDFVDLFGQDERHWHVSIDALARYTKRSSSEFAVRPFIIKHQDKMMAQMYEWSKDKNEHLRRLSSEGCRPALPWAQAIISFKKDPTPILPILETLKADDSLYVRKSVANNINDISKTHPELIIDLAKKWYGKNDKTNWIVKHGLRTLLKKANPDALAIFGYHNTAITVEDFKLDKSTIKIGEENTFSFTISSKETTKIRLEYGIDFMKANGKHSRKIFQISETVLPANKKKKCDKKHSFADLSTRKHYPGVHKITLIINGVAQGTLEFELK